MTGHLENYLNTLVGKSIKLNRKGPQSKTGMLLDQNPEFLTVLTEEDGVTYYTMHHLKSVSHNAKVKETTPLELPEDFTFKTANTFKELLSQLEQVWVHINHGPDKVEGVLCAVDDEWATIITHDEVVRVNIFHLKTLSYGNKIQKNEDKNENANANDDKKENKNANDNKKEDTEK